MLLQNHCPSLYQMAASFHLSSHAPVPKPDPQSSHSEQSGHIYKIYSRISGPYSPIARHKSAKSIPFYPILRYAYCSIRLLYFAIQKSLRIPRRLENSGELNRFIYEHLYLLKRHLILHSYVW